MLNQLISNLEKFCFTKVKLMEIRYDGGDVVFTGDLAVL